MNKKKGLGKGLAALIGEKESLGKYGTLYVPYGGSPKVL